MTTVSKLEIVLEATTTAFDRGLKSTQEKLKGFAKSTNDLHRKMDKFNRRHAKSLESMRAIGAVSTVALVAMFNGK